MREEILSILRSLYSLGLLMYNKAFYSIKGRVEYMSILKLKFKVEERIKVKIEER